MIWLVLSCLMVVVVVLASCGGAVSKEEAVEEEEVAVGTERAVSESLIARIDLSSWIEESLTVSPDSKRVAYVAIVGNKVLVVVDGEEGGQYDGIGEGEIAFDSPDSLYYLATRGNSIYLVEERID